MRARNPSLRLRFFFDGWYVCFMICRLHGLGFAVNERKAMYRFAQACQGIAAGIGDSGTPFRTTQSTTQSRNRWSPRGGVDSKAHVLLGFR
jgi:hypothetical protein